MARWNARFARGEDTHDFRPSPPLPQVITGVLPGRALDLACGAGRHTIFLAENGWHVVAVDGSHVGVEVMLKEARRRGVQDLIEAHVADLEADPPEFTIRPDGYDLIADFYYLHRALFPAIRRGVVPGGLVVAAIHLAAGVDEAEDRFLLAPGELERTVREWGWDVLYASEGASAESEHKRATAEIVARRPRTAKGGDPPSGV
jgi:SAM-dependent methyltransferase